MTTFDTDLELARVARYGELTLVLLTEHAERIGARHPEISAWSPLDHLAHVALANELVLRNVQSLAKREGLLVRQGLEPNPDAIAVLAEGRIPRGRAQAPRMVRPPETSVLADVAQWHRDNQGVIRSMRTQEGDRSPSTFSVSHQLLGPLDLAQWARFGAVHTRHHLAIAIEVLRAGGLSESAIPALEAIDPVR